MKKLSMIITTLLLSSLLLFTSCEDPVDPNLIDEDLPVVKVIEASSSTVLKETSIEVSVQADAASSYEWTADAGTFADPTASTTNWTAPSVSDPTIYKLQCTVKNGAGARKASVSVKVVASVLPDGVTAYWSFDTDLIEEAGGFAPEGGVGVSITSDAYSGSGAALFEGEDGNTESALFYPDANAPMGPDDLFTISFWVNTEDEGLGFCFGRSFEGAEYVEGAKGIYIEEGVVIFDISWVGAFELWESEVRVNDGEWHHIVFVKGEEEALIYVDGEEEFAGPIEEWSDDEDTMVTIGAAAEEEGGDWPGTFQGMLDDIRYYPEALDEDAIIAINEGG